MYKGPGVAFQEPEEASVAGVRGVESRRGGESSRGGGKDR